MKFKNTSIILSLLGGVFPQASYSMDPPPIVELEDCPTPRRSSIIIPSNPEITGMKEAKFPTSQIKQSWQNLTSFTNQTIENLCNGMQRGICYVHSLEDIMGATDCFTTNWNLHHPNDQRNPAVEKFHEVFTHQEYVDHYIPYVLASRPLISGSILAFNNHPAFTLSDTFAPVSFILQVPTKCVGIISRTDAHTPVAFFPQKCEVRLNQLQRKINQLDCPPITLDALVRYPEFHISDSVRFFPAMNEIAIFNCAKGKDKVYRPSVAGVLFNPSYGSMKADYGNAPRNILWKAAAEEFCKQQNLPFLTLDVLNSVSREDAETMVIQEWFADSSRMEQYAFHRYRGEDNDPMNPYIIKDNTFLLSDEQLKGYLLKR